MSALELDLNTLAALPNDRTKMALIALARKQQEAQRERFRLAAERQNALRRNRRRQWADDPWVKEVHAEAKRMLAELQQNAEPSPVTNATRAILDPNETGPDVARTTPGPSTQARPAEEV